jgi:putative membrane-bound dehydrogenase-like protein
MHRRLIGVLICMCLSSPAFAQKQYGFDNTKSSGQPYLSPEETVRRMKVPPGFAVTLFAAEPMVVNPIAFTLDQRGRAWVIESFEYPKRTPPGKMPRDRIVILEDTNGDGVADKRTVFAEGKDFPVRFDLASGLEVGFGGCFVGAPPYLWHLKDTNGDDKADTFEILLKGFGSQDTHETLNTFTWGPDGWLYGLHGVFTNSKVTSTEPNAGSPPVEIDAGVWRYHPIRKKFEIYSEGTSNPWGMDFAPNGNCFLCCCVIPHLFHMIPGGIYRRQAGVSRHPYAFGELKEICDHTFHKESGWAHAGLLYLTGPSMPKEYHDSVIFGSIHGCSIKRNTLKRHGTTYVASRADDFLVSGDKNFRPINLRWGPRGEIYVSDWHDQHPCHQTHPDAWDYDRGRIYRIVPTAVTAAPARDLAKLTPGELIECLDDPRPFVHRTVARLLMEEPRRITAVEHEVLTAVLLERGNLRALPPLLAWNDVVRRDASAAPLPLSKLLAPERPAEFQAEVIRQLGDDPQQMRALTRHMANLAATDLHPAVELAMVCHLVRADPTPEGSDTLRRLLTRVRRESDLVLPLMHWLAFEKLLHRQPAEELSWLAKTAPGHDWLTTHIVPRAFRRLSLTGDPQTMELVIARLADATDRRFRREALRGLAEGLRNQLVDAPPSWARWRDRGAEATDKDEAVLIRQIAARFRDPQAIAAAIKTLQDRQATLDDRREATRTITLNQAKDAVPALLAVLADDPNLEARQMAAAALGAFDDATIPTRLLTAWSSYPAPVRLELVNVLRGRKAWAKLLLDAVGQGKVARTDLTDNVILAIRGFNDASLNAQIESVWGRYRPTPKDLEALIAKMRDEVRKGPADVDKGKAVFQKNCLQCHKFEGQGHDVGPNLDGADRSLDYLLINILDPNRVVGAPYYTRVVLLKNGKLVTGLPVAEDDRTLSLKRENAVVEVINKADIEEARITEKSLMPEGLGYNLTVQDFRDLIRYLEKR